MKKENQFFTFLIKREGDIQMKNKTRYLFVSIAALVLLILNLYDGLVLRYVQAKEFVISPITVFCGYAGRPAFWVLIGFLVVLLLNVRFDWGRVEKPASTFLLCGAVAWVVLYAGMILWQVSAGTIPVRTAAGILKWLIKNPPAFLIPGLFLGLGVRKGRG